MKDKTIAAVIAAVTQYMDEEQAALAAAEVVPAAKAVPIMNLWGLTGRDEIMRMRGLWQLHLLRKQGIGQRRLSASRSY